MPKLPEAQDLSGVSPNAVRQFVPIPNVDIQGAYNDVGSAIGRGVGNLGRALTSIEDKRQEEFRKGERFDAKMRLIEAEGKYNEEASKLDPLADDYPDKVAEIWDSSIKDIMTGVQDPENKRYFGESLLENRFRLKTNAGEQQRGARVEKAKLDLDDYKDYALKKIDAGEDPETARKSLQDMIHGNPWITNENDIRNLEDALLPLIDMRGLERKATTLRSSAGDRDGYYARLAQIESGGKDNAFNKDSGAAGRYQFIPSTAKQYGLANPYDREQSEIAVRKFTEDNRRYMRKALGREPTAGEMYLAHQQGAGGAARLLANPLARATDIVGKRAVTLNGGNAGMSAGDFANMWISKFEGVEAPSGDAWIDPTPSAIVSRISQDPSFLRLPVDQQDKFKSEISKRLESMDKEENKELSRAAVEYAVSNIPDQKEATEYIKQTITDPEAQKSALSTLNTEYKRIQGEQREKVWDAVLEATDQGDTAAAFEAIPDDLDPREKIRIRRFIESGAKSVSLDTPGQILDQRLREIGIDTSTKAKPADINATAQIRRIATENLEDAKRRAKRNLSPSEVEKVLDETFLQFRVQKKGLIWDSEEDFDMKDVLDEFSTFEEDYGAPTGEYLSRAEKAIRARGMTVTPKLLRGWLKAAVDNGVIKKQGEAE
jgi:hypothetical protein